MPARAVHDSDLGYFRLGLQWKFVTLPDVRAGRFGFDIPEHGQEILLLYRSSRPALEPTPSFSLLTGVLSLGQDGRDAKLTADLHLVPRLISSLLCILSRCIQRLFTSTVPSVNADTGWLKAGTAHLSHFHVKMHHVLWFL